MTAYQVQKAIIPIAGMGTRFLPLSLIFPKEFLPLGEKPLLHHIIQEAKDSGVTDCIFVTKPGRKYVADYFNPPRSLEKFLQAKKRSHLLSELEKIQELKKELSFSFVAQKIPLGDAHAIFLATRERREEPCAVLFSDDIIVSKTPGLMQLKGVFRTAQKPIIAIKRIGRERISQYGVVEVERIANRFYKIKRIVEKPASHEAPSDFAIVGRYVLTPEALEYIHQFVTKKTKIRQGKNRTGEEFLLTDVFNTMMADGKILYGYEIEGEWLECGTKENLFRSNLYMALQNPEYRKLAKEYLK
jgi:UTP--glucose-1-phosphate uridylyltransferase